MVMQRFAFMPLPREPSRLMWRRQYIVSDTGNTKEGQFSDSWLSFAARNRAIELIATEGSQ